MPDSRRRGRKDIFMAFFNSAVDVLQTLVVALGAGLGIWGVINLMEGYGNDNPGAKRSGKKKICSTESCLLTPSPMWPLSS